MNKYILALCCFAILTIHCEFEKESIRKYRNGNYEWLLDFFKQTDLTCVPSEGVVLFDKKFGELEVDDSHASKDHPGKYELQLKSSTKFHDNQGYFNFYLSEIRDSSFLIEYNSEHRYPSSKDENVVEVHQDKGRMRCRCDIIR